MLHYFMEIIAFTAGKYSASRDPLCVYEIDNRGKGVHELKL
jgi:hypothetical protein